MYFHFITPLIQLKSLAVKWHIVVQALWWVLRFWRVFDCSSAKPPSYSPMATVNAEPTKSLKFAIGATETTIQNQQLR